MKKLQTADIVELIFLFLFLSITILFKDSNHWGIISLNTFFFPLALIAILIFKYKNFEIKNNCGKTNILLYILSIYSKALFLGSIFFIQQRYFGTKIMLALTFGTILAYLIVTIIKKAWKECCIIFVYLLILAFFFADYFMTHCHELFKNNPCMCNYHCILTDFDLHSHYF